MFLCKSCHKHASCGWGFVEGGSRGQCECCYEVANCIDCHGYDFRGSDHRHPELGEP
jgi:hypothetical protein